MSPSVAPFTHYAKCQLQAFGARAKSVIEDWSYHLGRKFETFRHDVLPDVVQQTKDISLALLKNYFFVIPGLAFTLGHYTDVGVSTLVCGVGLADWILDDRDVRSASTMFFGVSIGLSLALRTIDIISNTSSFAAVGIGFHIICLAKLILIGTGKNTQNGDIQNVNSD